jgi:hypothetical protein
MASAICWKCFENKHLSELVKQEGEREECSVCGEEHRSFTIERLGELLEGKLREHIRPGRELPVLGEGDDDHVYYEQQGDPLSYWVQEVLGQYFDFEDEIVDAVVAAEDCDPRDGDIPFFDSAADYEPLPVSLQHYYDEWKSVLEELKHGRRFFSVGAQSLFARLFQGVDTMMSFVKATGKHDRVVWELPKASKLYRARMCESQSRLNQFHAHPMETVGPPPTEHARAGRMNADGVVVFYGAMDSETCLAEMRPALGGDTAVIELQTTRRLRMLDFTRLEKSYGEGLSYFQPDFNEEVARCKFLRRLHNLISQPVVPSREADYVITQTMAEYLAYVHQPSFDGILFKSVQRAEGTNVVLFAERHEGEQNDGQGKPRGERAFPITYVDKSLQLFSTEEIKYKHRQWRLIKRNGTVNVSHEDEYDDFYNGLED